MLAPGGDGGRNFVRLGSGQDEDDPRRRLFDRLQQSIERFAGDLVSLVDDENLVAVPRRPIADIFPQLAHFVDAAVRGGVDFDYIHGPAGRDLQAARAHPARLICWSVNAIQTARQNAGHRGLARAALAGKDVAVRDPVLRDGVLDRGLDVLLIDYVGKRLGPVFPGDDLVHGGTLSQAPGDPRHTG